MPRTDPRPRRGRFLRAMAKRFTAAPSEPRTCSRTTCAWSCSCPRAAPADPRPAGTRSADRL